MPPRRVAIALMLASAACTSPFGEAERAERAGGTPPTFSNDPPVLGGEPAPVDPGPTPAPTPTPEPAAPQPGLAAGPIISSPYECVEKNTHGTANTWTITVKLDPASSLITESFGGRVTYAYRYDADKRLAAVAYWGTNPTPTPSDFFQRDYSYDAKGHIGLTKLSPVTAPPLYVPVTSASAYSFAYINTYATSGALTQSIYVPSGATTNDWPSGEQYFTENASQECERIERRAVYPNGGPTFTTIETRTYADGRVTRVDTTGHRRCGFAAPYDDAGFSTTIFTYDAQGRMTQQRFWCDGTQVAETALQSTTITYGADGSHTVEFVDYLTDVGPGVPRVTERSAYCAEIDAWRGGPRAAALPSTKRCTAL